ncbi:MAG: AAA family ATPase, partial [candidate division Zixibacteria bacterium]|nr:AAA family ATPase [candidate division Zixibacteria bacterium]
MRVKSIRIKNFRSIENLEIEVPSICALVGPNNSGKSNVLLAIRKVLAGGWVNANTFSEDDVYTRDPNKDILIELALDNPISYQKFKGAPAVDVHGVRYLFTRYKIGEKKGERRLEQSCLDANGRPVNAPQGVAKKGEQSKFAPMLNIPSDVQSQMPVVYMGTNRPLKFHLPNAQFSLLRPLIDDVDADFNSPSNTVPAKTSDGTSLIVPRSERFKKFMDAAM